MATISFTIVDPDLTNLVNALCSAVGLPASILNAKQAQIILWQNIVKEYLARQASLNATPITVT